MADGNLTSAHFADAFTLSRSEAGSYRDAAGTVQVAAPNVPRFDHDPDGVPLGLLIAAGVALGGGDAAAIKPAALPAGMVTGVLKEGRSVTILHEFDPGTGALRCAWYSSNAVATINALLAQAGHHRMIAVVPGFRENIDGYAWFRGQQWRLPPLLADGTANVLGAKPLAPLIIHGTAD